MKTPDPHNFDGDHNGIGCESMSADREPGWQDVWVPEPPDHRGFDETYAGVPPWDIGRPQPEVVRTNLPGCEAQAWRAMISLAG